MLGERRPVHKLLLASLAATRGSEAAARRLLASTKRTDLHTVLDTHDAINLALRTYQQRKQRAPAWTGVCPEAEG
jgi:hypothetical protein